MTITESIQSLKDISDECLAGQSALGVAADDLIARRSLTDATAKELTEAEENKERIENNLLFEQITLAKAKDPSAQITGSNEKEREIQREKFFVAEARKNSEYDAALIRFRRAQNTLDAAKNAQAVAVLKLETATSISRLLIARAEAWGKIITALSVLEQEKGIAKNPIQSPKSL